MATRRDYLRALGAGSATTALSGCVTGILGVPDPNCYKQFSETYYVAGQKMGPTDARLVPRVATEGKWITPGEGDYLLLVEFHTRVVDESASHLPSPASFRLRYNRTDFRPEWLNKFIVDGRIYYTYQLRHFERADESIAYPKGTVLEGWVVFPTPSGFKPQKAALTVDYESPHQEESLCWVLPALEKPSPPSGNVTPSAPNFEPDIEVDGPTFTSADKDRTILVVCRLPVANTGRAAGRVVGTLQPQSGDWNRIGSDKARLQPGEQTELKPYVYLTEWEKTMSFVVEVFVDERDTREERIEVETFDREVQITPTDTQ